MRNPDLTTAAEIQDWCINHIAGLLGEAPASIDPDADFDRLGLDSALAVSMLLDLEEVLGDMPIPPEVLFEYATLREVSQHLASESARLSEAERRADAATVEEMVR